MTDRRFGLSNYILATPFTDADVAQLDVARELGYDVFEFCVDDPATVSIAAVRERAAANGLGISVTGGFGPDRDASHPEADVRANAVDYLRVLVDYAAELGSPTVSGPMFTAVAVKLLQTPQEREAQLERAAESLRLVADYAADRDVRLAMEPLNRFESHLINTVDQGLDLIGRIGRDNVGFVLDTFHMNIEEKNLGDAIRRAGSRVFGFQASENDRGIVGSGNVDWAGCWAALDDIGFGGPIVVESFIATPQIAPIGGLWRPVANSMRELAVESLAYLRTQL